MGYPPQAYFKSLVYLVSFTGIGYILMKLTEPNSQKLQKIRESSGKEQLSYEQRQKKLMLDRIKSLAESKPISSRTSDDK